MLSIKRSVLFVAAAAALTVSGAQAQVRDAGAKARGEFGGSRSGTSVSRSAPVYRAPAIVGSEVTPSGVADDGRTFSYEPSTEAGVSGGCGGMSAAAPQPSRQAARAPRTYSFEPAMPSPASRTFSYEPSTRSYGSGMMRSRSNVPSFALPRTDARKHSGGR